MSQNFFIFVFVLLSNLWVWKIFGQNLLLGLLLVSASVLLYRLIIHKGAEALRYIFLVLFALLLFSQWQTTQPSSLTLLDNDQKRVQQMRLNEYPPIGISIAGKKLWIPLAHWFEGRRETIAAFRIKKNFSEAIDPMLYFFANHPRERVGVEEFEKFPYILLPFFIFGIFSLSKKFRNKSLALSLLAPLVLISFIGNKNPLGPFSLFPFLAVATATGITKAYKKIALMPKNKFKPVLLALFALFALVFLQVISYAKY
ncbi:hypothetical protein IID21_01130 [Patescibacteria group bacterium]|nr:hypothetical protein [Patescibacteria group bacterium]